MYGIRSANARWPGVPPGSWMKEHSDFSGMPDRAILWVDISVIDLGHAAGAVGLNPAGMKPETLVSVIAAMTCSWQAIVITGLAPARDTRGMSELTAN